MSDNHPNGRYGGGVVVPIQRHMSSAVTKFIAHEQLVGYATRTIDRRVSTVQLYHRWLAGTGEVCGRDAVEGFMASRRSQQTRASYLGDLRRFYGWAVERGILELDPTVGVSTPIVPAREPSPLDHPDVLAVLAACRGRQDRLVIGLGLYAGLRVSEIAGLTPSDVRWRDGLLSVTGKGNKTRRIPIAPVLAPDLAGGQLVSAATRSGVGARIGRVFDRAGVVGRPHDLRHTFATELARQSNGNLQLVAELMGHASLQTTRRYCRWLPSGAEHVAQLYNAA